MARYAFSHNDKTMMRSYVTGYKAAPAGSTYISTQKPWRVLLYAGHWLYGPRRASWRQYAPCLHRGCLGLQSRKFGLLPSLEATTMRAITPRWTSRRSSRMRPRSSSASQKAVPSCLARSSSRSSRAARRRTLARYPPRQDKGCCAGRPLSHHRIRR